MTKNTQWRALANVERLLGALYEADDHGPYVALEVEDMPRRADLVLDGSWNALRLDAALARRTTDADVAVLARWASELHASNPSAFDAFHWANAALAAVEAARDAS